jgi:NAD+ kinase
VGISGLKSLVENLKNNTIAWQTVARVKALITKASSGETLETVPVLNDLLYANANPAATTRYKILFRDRYETHRSSGIWFATGMGSTAAILAAGGERRPQTDPLFQFRVRELYKLGHKLPEIEGAIFDPDIHQLEIENRCPQAILATDGQHGNLDLGYGDIIRIKRGPLLHVAIGLHAGE